MTLERITSLNASAFDILAQDYEEEFSPITGKKKNQQGQYELDSDWREPNKGYYWVQDETIKGFCIKGELDSFNDIFEFYVVPSFRNKGVGEKIAFALFDLFPGKWQVRQIEGATAAKIFWRKVIDKYTSGNFNELIFQDSYWGTVTCQRFESKPRKED